MPASAQALVDVLRGVPSRAIEAFDAINSPAPKAQAYHQPAPGLNSGLPGAPASAGHAFTPQAWTPPSEFTMAQQSSQYKPPPMPAYIPSPGFDQSGQKILTGDETYSQLPSYLQAIARYKGYSTQDP